MPDPERIEERGARREQPPTSGQPSLDPQAQVRYERSDMSARAVAIVAATTAALLIVALGGVWLLVRKLDARERAANPPRPPLQAGGDERPAGLPQPPLEGLPAQPPGSDRRAADTADDQIAAERDLLDSYGWVDRDKGIVRVPLERAARIALENRDKYLPAREQQPWWKAPVRGDKP